MRGYHSEWSDQDEESYKASSPSSGELKFNVDGADTGYQGPTGI